MESCDKEVIKIKPRKESSSSDSSISTTSSFSSVQIEEDTFLIKKISRTKTENGNLKPRKLSNEEFEIILTEKEREKINEKKMERLNENKKIKKTCSQKIFECFKCKSKNSENEIENKLIEDQNKSIEEIIMSKGFKCEKHKIKTEDGYILILFRIPGGKNCENGSKLPPVLLQHGIFDSSDGWVCNGEEHSLAFVLANHNFDVWLSNSRGNKYCKNHDTFEENSFEFWQFSFHDLGIFDIPAVIKYIRKINESGEKLIYFGHSQGATLMLSGLVEKLEFFKENIKLFVALAPVARLNNIGSTLLNILCKINVHKFMEKIKVYEICPHTERTNKLMNFMNNHANGLVNFFLGLISDSNSNKCNDKNSLSVYLTHYPCGTSLKCLIHFIQIMKAKKFIYFDYKNNSNFEIYHQNTPPEYDLSKIKELPIIIITGEKDKLANPNDVRWLFNELKSNVKYFNIVPNMGHLSFLCGKNFSWFNEPLDIIMEEFYPKN